MATGNNAINSIEALISSIEETNRALKNVSRVIGKTSEDLSRVGVDKFTKDLKDAAKQTGILNEEQLSVIKSLRDFEKAVEIQESLANKIRAAQAKRDKEINEATKLEKKVRDDLVRVAKEQYTKQMFNLGLTVKQAEAAADNTDEFRKNSQAIAANITKYDKLNKTLETHGSSIKENVSKFASLATSATLLKKAFVDSYEQMNRLTQRGMLGAFTSINLMAPKLLLLPQELEDLINKNRDLINVFGGGIQGLEAFGKELGNAREGLEYLGREGTRAASRFIETAKAFGLTPKDGKAYQQTMKNMKDQFRQMSGLFGDSYEEYAQLIEAQAEDENYRRRLNSMSKERVALEVGEIQRRTENLKLMGLSNQQITEFNRRLEDMYNPRKNTQVQRRTEGAMFSNLQSNMMNMLASNPALSGQLKGLQATAGTGRKLAQLHAQGRGSEINSIMSSAEGRAFMQAQAAASNAIDNNFSDTGRYGTNVLRERSGGLGSLIDSTSFQADTARAKNRDIMGNPELERLKSSAMSLTGANSALEQGFKATTVAMEGLRAIMGNPLATAAAGAVAGLLAVAGAGKLIGKATDFLGGAGGKGGKTAFGARALAGRFAGSMVKGGGVAGAGAFAGYEVWQLGSALKSLYDAKNHQGVSLSPAAQARINSGALNAPAASSTTSQDPAVAGSKGWGNASDNVKNAITSASATVGVNPGLMATMAAKESGFNPGAVNSQSNATGLYQFTRDTWMASIKKFGAKHGINVAGMSQDQILALRTDPRLNSLMGAELLKDNQRITGDSSNGGTYLAHFLGAPTAKKVLGANPNTPIEQLVTAKQMQQNANIFSGNRTAGQLRNWATSAMGSTANVATAPTTTTAEASTAPTGGGDPAVNELRRQTSLLAAIAANTGVKIRASDSAYKADSTVVANGGLG